MFVTFDRATLFVTLVLLVLNASESEASQPPIVLPGGQVVPGGSCGMGVTSRKERTAILTRWLLAPAVAGTISLMSAVVIRRRLRFVSDQRRRSRLAVVVGILGGVALMFGLFVLVVGGLHAFNVFSLYEPIF